MEKKFICESSMMTSKIYRILKKNFFWKVHVKPADERKKQSTRASRTTKNGRKGFCSVHGQQPPATDFPVTIPVPQEETKQVMPKVRYHDIGICLQCT